MRCRGKDTVEQLMDFNCDINANSVLHFSGSKNMNRFQHVDGTTALMVFTRERRRDCVDMICSLGADIAAKDVGKLKLHFFQKRNEKSL